MRRVLVYFFSKVQKLKQKDNGRMEKWKNGIDGIME
ncbi:hypothetical protein ES705_04688 [subsurface metagenome]